MKKLIVLATLLAVTASQGAVVRWGGNALGGSTDWADGGSWTADFATTYGVPTAADSHALIGDQSGNFGVINMPIISSVVNDVPGAIGVGWDDAWGGLTVADGGQLIMSQLYVGWGGAITSTGQLTMATGSFMTGGGLNLGSGGDNRGSVFMTGGLIHVGAVALGDGARVDMGGDALFFVNGDFTGAGLIDSTIFAIGAGESVVETYNSADGRTEWSVIPEPATFGLFALMGGALLFARRNFRN